MTAFSMRTRWERGTECSNPAQDEDDGCRARLALYNCSVAFAGPPGGTPPNASRVRPPLPFVADPYRYHMKNIHRNDVSHIRSFGADPGERST